MTNIDKPIAVFAEELLMQMRNQEIVERINPQIVQAQINAIVKELEAAEAQGASVAKINALVRRKAQLSNLLKMKSEGVEETEELIESRRSTPLLNLMAAGAGAVWRAHKRRQERKKPQNRSVDLYHHPEDNHFYGHIHGHAVEPMNERKLRGHLINHHGYHPQDAEDIIQHTKSKKALKTGNKRGARKEAMLHHLHQALTHNEAFENTKEHATIKVDGELKNKRLHHREQRDFHADQARRHGFRWEKHEKHVVEWHKNRQTPKEHEDQVRKHDEDSVHAKSAAERWAERNKAHSTPHPEGEQKRGPAGHTPTRWAKDYDPKDPFKHVGRYDADAIARRKAKEHK